jgi:capsular exopolysaccharide synthesis family protein
MRRTGRLADSAATRDDNESVFGRYPAEANPAAAEPAAFEPLFEPPPPPTEVHHTDAPLRSEPAPPNRSAMDQARRSNGDVTGSRHSGDEVRIVDALWALYRRKWLIAAVVAAALAGAIAYNRTAQPIYEARARLLLEPNIPDVVPFRASSADQGRLDYYLTQLEVLKSQSIARKTLENLNLLDTDPRRQPAQVGELLRRLVVVPVRTDVGESRVISVSYQSPRPDLAAAIPNGIAQTYLDQLLEERRQANRDAGEWLNQRLAELRRAVQESEGALQRYREQKDSVSLGDEQNIVVQKLAQLNALVTSARTDRLEKEAVYQQLQAMQESGTPLDTFSAILGNSFIQGLKADLASLEAEREALSERRGELHPEMIKLNTAIATAERRLNEEMEKVVSGIQNDYRAAVAKEGSLNAALEEQKREVLSLSQKSIGYSELQRDAASTQQMFQTVLQRAKEADLQGNLQSSNAKILDLAEVPRGPVWPRTQLNLILASVGGLFLGAVLVFGMEYLNPRLVEPADVSEALGIPLLGLVPVVARVKKRPAAFGSLPLPFQEAIRVIRTRIFLSPLSGAMSSMAVTSTHPGEGKTAITANLAASIAMVGRRVLLIDADLRRPQVHTVFGIARSPGLSELIAGQAKAGDVCVESSVKGLFVLPAGGKVVSPSDLLDRGHVRQLIQELGRSFDVILLDCPPVMAVADAAIVANVATSVLFVVGCGVTTRKAALGALDRLASVEGQVMGAVLNKARVRPYSEYAVTKYLKQDTERFA